MTKEKKLKPDLPSGFVDRKGNELILKDRLTDIDKAKSYIKSGGTLDQIKKKYKVTKEQEKELTTL